MGFPAFRIGIMTEFFQIAWVSTLATERLKSSVRKVSPCSRRWRRWRTVSPSGGRAVEEPVFLLPLRRLSLRTAYMSVHSEAVVELSLSSTIPSPHRVPNGDILPNNVIAEVLAVEANLRERALTLLMFISPRRRPAS